MAIQERIRQTKFSSECERAFVSFMYVANRLMQRLDETCSQHGLTHTQYNVLRILRGVHPEGHSRCEIVKRLISRAPDVTRLIDRLERMELVERGWSETNRRLSIATITAKGLRLLDKMVPDMRRIQEETTGRLKSADRQEFARLCDLMAAADDEEDCELD